MYSSVQIKSCSLCSVLSHHQPHNIRGGGDILFCHWAYPRKIYGRRSFCERERCQATIAHFDHQRCGCIKRNVMTTTPDDEAVQVDYQAERNLILQRWGNPPPPPGMHVSNALISSSPYWHISQKCLCSFQCQGRYCNSSTDNGENLQPLWT